MLIIVENLQRMFNKKSELVKDIKKVKTSKNVLKCWKFKILTKIKKKV